VLGSPVELAQFARHHPARKDRIPLCQFAVYRHERDEAIDAFLKIKKWDDGGVAARFENNFTLC
jgi:hypothetical protein